MRNFHLYLQIGKGKGKREKGKNNENLFTSGKINSRTHRAIEAYVPISAKRSPLKVLSGVKFNRHFIDRFTV